MMQRSALVSLLFLLLTGLGCNQALTVRPPPDDIRNAQTNRWMATIKEKAAPGDWLVTRGYTDSDNLVVAATNIPISHTAVLDNDRDQVIEAVGSGVRVSQLRSFIHNSHRILLMRPKWWTPERGPRAVNRARKAVGKEYDFMGAVGGNVPERFYCTELAVWSYKPYHTDHEHFPTVLEPGQMYLWATILFDSQPRN